MRTPSLLAVRDCTGLRLVGAGVLIGFVVSLGVARWVSSLFYETRADDPITFVAVRLVLTGVATVFC